ncbi:hypothetical protein Taro_017994 [Colocasia esculenta]|uniref:Uncharacterized protein n=1 Tax=Colocasia esculenta TaxID=4460 RepID=A0A843UPQ5_COLES|nr:hypothetical protein [Colocasia esculenta]
MTVVTLSACLPSLRPPSCQANLCPSATATQEIVLLSGLYLVAFGSGGVKSSLCPHGADQFHDENPADREKKASFFSSFYNKIYNKILNPIIRRHTGNRRGLSQLQRIGVGRMLMVIAMTVAATLEAKRLESARVGKVLGMAWQPPHSTSS